MTEANHAQLLEISQYIEEKLICIFYAVSRQDVNVWLHNSLSSIPAISLDPQMSLIMVQENEFWVFGSLGFTVSFHTHEHSDVKYNISVYLYHPVLILHVHSVISTVKIITEEKRMHVYLLVLVRYFNLINWIFSTIYLEHLSRTDRCECRVQGLIIYLQLNRRVIKNELIQNEKTKQKSKQTLWRFPWPHDIM